MTPGSACRGVTLVKNLFGREQAVQGSGKTGIHRHLDHDFNDFAAGTSHVERAVNVHLQLGRGRAMAVKAATVAISRDFKSSPGRE